MYFNQIFDKKLAQYSYLIGCQSTGEAIVIDPMKDIDRYYEILQRENLRLTSAADTHIHADYVSGLRELAEDGVHVYASDAGTEDWKYEWLRGSSYDYELITGGDVFKVGNIVFEVLHTPGHTPESISMLVTDGAAAEGPMGILTGDFVFVGDVGRPDLLEKAAGQRGAMVPAAKELFKSVEKFKSLPSYLQVWPGHGSGSACGKALGAVPESTVGYELRYSPAFRAATCEEEFIDFILDGQPEPPLYFSRMKKVNREGPRVLGTLPDPSRLAIDDIVKSGGTILDTRQQKEFMKSHVPGSLLAVYDNNFNTTAGSYVDPESDLYLIIEEKSLGQAVRELVRVGLDRISGYATPSDLETWQGETSMIKRIDFDGLEAGRKDPNAFIVDVRKATEYEEGHVPGSINIAHIRLAGEMHRLPGDKRILVHCASGQRSAYASALLARNGFEAEWVDGDYAEWQNRHASGRQVSMA